MIRHWLHYGAAPFALWRLPVVRVHGRTSSGDPGTLLMAGTNATLRMLAARLLPDDRRYEEVGRRTWQALVRQDDNQDDMTMLRVPCAVADLFHRGRRVAMPDAIGMKVDVLAMAERARRSHSVAHNMRRSRRNDLEVSVTEGDQDFALFYNTMYLPFATGRFDEAAQIRTFTQLRRLARKGGILWLSELEGPRIAALLLVRRPPYLDAVAMGSILGPDKVRRRGISTAIYDSCANHAATIGLAGLRLGGAMPWLTDGVLRFKARWGAVMDALPNIHRRSLIGWERPSPLVRAFLDLAPILHVAGRDLALVPEDKTGLRSVPGLPTSTVPSSAGRSSAALHSALWQRTSGS